MSRRLRLGALVLVAATAPGACAAEVPAVEAAEERTIDDLDAQVPTRLAGFRVEEEDISDVLSEGRRPYLDAASLYSFREEDDLLQATLQIGRFAQDVDPDDPDFRERLLSSIGAGGRTVRMGDRQLYLTGADRQTLSVWFDSGHLFILSTRDGFEAGRTLLREALRIEP